MSQHSEILDAFQVHGLQMTLGEILKYPFGYEFRARKTEINSDTACPWMIRFVKEKSKGTASDNLYVLERKPKPGDML